MLGEVADQRPATGASESGHPVLHVCDEAFAGLLTVVADVDARGDLRGDHLGGRRLDRVAQLVGIDVLAAAASPVQRGERLRPGQAAGVCGQDP